MVIYLEYEFHVHQTENRKQRKTNSKTKVLLLLLLSSLQLWLMINSAGLSVNIGLCANMWAGRSNGRSIAENPTGGSVATSVDRSTDVLTC